jgi:hypothetical protein
MSIFCKLLIRYVLQYRPRLILTEFLKQLSFRNCLAAPPLCHTVNKLWNQNIGKIDICQHLPVKYYCRQYKYDKFCTSIRHCRSVLAIRWRHDTQHNDIKHYDSILGLFATLNINDTEHNNTQHWVPLCWLYEKIVAQNKSYLLLKNHFYNIARLQLI